jgi:hypothetical protein
MASDDYRCSRRGHYHLSGDVDLRAADRKGLVMKVTYAIWRDYRTGTFEVVRWEDKRPTIVQANILTRGKAMAAADTWRQREKEREQNRR